MMRHLFEEYKRSFERIAVHPMNHFLSIRFLSSKHFFSSRMLCTAKIQVMRIEGFIYHMSIAALCKRVHHCR